MVTPAFLVGWGLSITGALLTVYCYRVLGPQYTFQRAVVEEHQLVTTKPYAIVRHPAYLGFYLTYVGLLVVQLAQGSWIWECSVSNTWAGRAVAAGVMRV